MQATMQTHCLSDVRLCITGGSNVGKSAITVRFLTRRFIGEYQQNVEQTYRGLMDFGADTITYDLKDTSGLLENSFLSTWPTCIAVIYSINDIGSFATASKLLDDIDRSVHCINGSTNDAPPLALIGNKCDLEHLRYVEEEEGQKLADKHGATFWEASASEDYYSTFRPLTSLIIKSFLKWKKSCNVASSYHSAEAEDKSFASILSDGEIQNLLRRYSEPTNNTSQLVSEQSLASECQRKGSDNILTRSHTSVNLNPTNNTIKREKKLQELGSKSLEKITSKSPSSTRMTIPITSTTCVDNKFPFNKDTVDITNASNSTTLARMTRNTRSQSLPKSNSTSFTSSSRLIQRKGRGSKKHDASKSTLPKGIEKSSSFTDLKTLQYCKMTLNENLDPLEQSSSIDARPRRSHSMCYSLSNQQVIGQRKFPSLHRSSSECHVVSDEKNSENLRSISTSSFLTLESNNIKKNLLNRLQKYCQKDKKPKDDTGSNRDGKFDTYLVTNGYDIQRSKSMREKFSTLFGH